MVHLETWLSFEDDENLQFFSQHNEKNFIFSKIPSISKTWDFGCIAGPRR